MPALLDLTGQQFGRWTVLGRAGRCGVKVTWRCRCECGQERDVSGDHLRRGGSRSCGCLQAEVATKHGGIGTPEYYSWQSMKDRCLNPNASHFDRYGGRGITVCKRWRDSFSAFLADIGPRPGPDYTLERIDNDGDYEPGNVRWATRAEQAANRYTCRMFSHGGKMMTIADWSRHIGMAEITLRSRIRLGWDFARAITMPVITDRERDGQGRYAKV